MLTVDVYLFLFICYVLRNKCLPLFWMAVHCCLSVGYKGWLYIKMQQSCSFLLGQHSSVLLLCSPGKVNKYWCQPCINPDMRNKIIVERRKGLFRLKQKKRLSTSGRWSTFLLRVFSLGLVLRVEESTTLLLFILSWGRSIWKRGPKMSKENYISFHLDFSFTPQNGVFNQKL